MRGSMVVLCVLAACPARCSDQIVIAPDAAVMDLAELGLYEIGYAYRGGKEQPMPDGWEGDFDDRSGIACMPAGEQNGRKALLLHPPWRGGVGYTYQQYTFALPKARKIILRGATAMRSDITDKSDGVTFRVYAGGRKLLDVHRKDAKWQPFEFDLTSLGGKTATIRFETDVGPNDNSGWDFALWGDRELVLEGFEPKSVKRPDPPPLDLSRVYSAQSGSAAPPDGFGGSRTFEMDGETAVFRYSGPDGALEYRWSLPAKGSDAFLGRLELQARMTGDDAVQLRLANAARLDWTLPTSLLQSRWEKSEDGVTCVEAFKVGDAEEAVRVRGRMVGKSLAMEVASEKPLVAGLEAGRWGPVLHRRPIPVPYYSGRVYYLPAQNLFVNSFLDWTFSNASNQDNTRANYVPLTDGSRNPLKERIIYSAAWHPAEVLPNISNPPSPWIGRIGDKIVLDTWGGAFTSIAESFERLAEYGITNCVALIHVWQRSGYDNALPMHIPANTDLGGDEGMKRLVETGKRLGYYVALHENYVDYYPNYDFFKESDIALDTSGKPIKAWFNAGTKIQSFAEKPNAILRLAGTQSPEIHSRYGTNADYLDVHSAVPPWFHVDFRAGEKGAGMFSRVWDVHRELWQYERDTHGGPVFGEGNAHWYWSGCLDGVEAQFGQGWPSANGSDAPLAVDFDLLRIHPLQFNHGMGYYERWASELGWGGIPPMAALDRYRMYEVAYGHAGFLGARTWSVLQPAWLEHHLMSPVTARYASAKPTEISYEIDGKWADGTAAAKAAKWDRLRVRYDSGLVVTANDSDTPMKVGELTLPRFGWTAQGAGVRAYTALVDGALADYAETDDSVFANARNADHWNYAQLKNVRPQVGELEQTAPREFRVTYKWIVNDSLDHDYSCFVHFDGKDAESGARDVICFQNDHELKPETSQWRKGTTVTDGPYTIKLTERVGDGDYVCYAGLFGPHGGPRVPLVGIDDGHGRIRLGVLHVEDGGKSITFEPETRTGDERLKLYAEDLNLTGNVLDFGTMRTDGSVLARREGSGWVLIPMPREKPFEIELSAKRFGRPDEVTCVGGSAATIKPVAQGERWRLTMNGAREYRW